MSQATLLDIGIWMTVIAAIVQTIFILTYATRPWWKSRVGRALFIKSLSLSVALWISASNAIVGVYPHQLEVSIGALAFITLAITYQTFALYVEVLGDVLDKRKHRKKDQGESHSPVVEDHETVVREL